MTNDGEEMIKTLELMAMKEAALSKIVAWLKGRGLWEACNDELGIVETGLRDALRDLPASNEYKADKYETDDEIVLHLWLPDGRSFDLKRNK